MDAPSSNRVVVLAPEIPYPATDGGMLRHLQIIRAVTCKYQCDLIAFAEPQDVHCQEKVKEALGLGALHLVEHPKRPKVLSGIAALLTLQPLGAILHRSTAFGRLVETKTSAVAYTHCIILGDICLLQYAPRVKGGSILWDMCDDLALVFVRKASLAKRFLQRWYYRLQARIVINAITAALPELSSVVVISEKDAASIPLNDCGVIEIPNTIDLEYYHPDASHDRKTSRSLLFTGAMGAFHNRDAVDYFIAEVWPRIKREVPEVSFYVVGKGHEAVERQDSGVVFTGCVDDVREYYWDCDVFVCPLRTGTGIKNKLLEAMACGCSIVATPVSIEGLEVVDGREVLVADNAEEIATAVIRLINDPALRGVLKVNARDFMQRNFSGITAESLVDRLICD